MANTNSATNPSIYNDNPPACKLPSKIVAQGSRTQNQYYLDIRNTPWKGTHICIQHFPLLFEYKGTSLALTKEPVVACKKSTWVRVFWVPVLHRSRHKPLLLCQMLSLIGNHLQMKNWFSPREITNHIIINIVVVVVVILGFSRQCFSV